MRKLCLFACFITAITILSSCNSSQVKNISVKSYLAAKQLIVCLPGGGNGEEWLEEHPGGIPALQGWGHYSWKVSTGSDSAQFYFDQGINMFYSFHMVEAYASFAKAALFDPALAIAYWGQALCKGPNINYPDIDSSASKLALAFIEKAKANLSSASSFEKELIEAIGSRYSTDTVISRAQLNLAYSQAMKQVYESNTGLPDAIALYADALMQEHPWDLYEQNETPKAGTPELVSLVEKGLALSPEHPALNHYYIHVVEASASPGRALPNADRLSQMLPGVAHMVHMPSHIYIRTGNYRKGVDVNIAAVQGFNNYLKVFPDVKEHTALYQGHNQHMQTACAMMDGESKMAAQTAKETRDNIPLSYIEQPSAFGNYIQSIYMMPTTVALRFGQWQQILDAAPAKSSIDFDYAFQLFAKGMASAATGNSHNATSYLSQLREKMKTPVLAERYASFANAALQSLQVAEMLLQGTIASRENRGEDAITYFSKAVAIEDGMMYNEPKDWLIPARHYLGNELVKAKHYVEAEEVYLADLHKNPLNPWSLAGLMTAQKALDKNKELMTTTQQFVAAAKHADINIRASIIE